MTTNCRVNNLTIHLHGQVEGVFAPLAAFSFLDFYYRESQTREQRDTKGDPNKLGVCL